MAPEQSPRIKQSKAAILKAPKTEEIPAAAPKIELTLPAIFPAKASRLDVFFKTKGIKNGDKLRGVWIAEDVGRAAAKETKIDETAIVADGDTSLGSLTLTKTKKWPVGKYRLEIYVGNHLAATARFRVVE